MKAIGAIVIAGIGVSLVAGAGALRGDGADLPLVQWAGADSQHEAGFFIVRDQAAWRELWTEHLGAAGEPGGAMNRHRWPEVNLERCIAVAFFRGPTTNEDGEMVREVDRAGGELRLRFVADTFQTASFDGPDHGVGTRPFGIWLLPATDDPIVIEEGRSGLKDQPLKWKQVHRFDAR